MNEKLNLSIYPDCGINLFGYIKSEFGLGESVRLLVGAFQSVEIPLNLLNFSKVPHKQATYNFNELQINKLYPINLIHINPDVLPAVITDFSEDYFINKYNIAYWYWELEMLPDSWKDYSYIFHEIWTASEFIATQIRKNTDVPVYVIPPPVLGPLDYNSLKKNSRKKGEKCIFLFIFDFLSVQRRKNPEDAINAFQTAFKNEDNTRLIIKSINGHLAEKELKNLEQIASRDKRIILINGYVPRSEIWELISESDCYISLHAAEGFGLTIAEAMIMEKPVIATAYSGNMDFMNNENSYPVLYNKKPINIVNSIYAENASWAEPDLNDCALKMRQVHDFPEEAAEKGERAREDILAKYNKERSGNLISRRIMEIAALINAEDFFDQPANRRQKIIFNYLRESEASKKKNLFQRMIQIPFAVWRRLKKIANKD
ncbi:MAG: glycosyltransferase [Candidatus Heimdallarchaeota archaeon]|nr:glycosyltransferase [Candidatus Heimdallarchaeota archaeon]